MYERSSADHPLLVLSEYYRGHRQAASARLGHPSLRSDTWRRGKDSDNAFIDNQLYRLTQRDGLDFTRSRPYHKNDNAHCEQKNFTYIHRLMG
jgi:hypothetical protein